MGGLTTCVGRQGATEQNTHLGSQVRGNQKVKHVILTTKMKCQDQFQQRC